MKNKKYIDRLRAIYFKLNKERESYDDQNVMNYPNNDILNLLDGLLTNEFNSSWKRGNNSYSSTITVEENGVKQTITRRKGGLKRKTIYKELTFNDDSSTLTFTQYTGKQMSDLVIKEISKSNGIKVIKQTNNFIESSIKKN